MTAVEQFRAAMVKAGLHFGGPIHADGKLYRFKAEGDKAKDSWYVFHANSPTAGVFGSWRLGFKETWCERDARAMSQHEWQIVREQWRRADAQRKQSECAARQLACKTAAWILVRSTRPATHGYLTRKGVTTYGDLYQYRGLLVLPLRDATGTLHSLQFVSADGTKKFLRGGRVAGCFFTLCDKADGPVVVCEGFATGASIFEATGYATVAAMNCGNLLAVAQAMRARWPEREFIIAADDDRATPGNPGKIKSTEAAVTIGARLAIPEFADVTTKPTDFNDLARLQGLEAVKTQIEAATLLKESDDDAIARLAKMLPIEYERCREAEAERLGIKRVGILDKLVAEKRPKLEAANAELQGRAMILPEVVPWPTAVDGAEVLSEASETFSRYVALRAGAADALALWVAHAHAFAAFVCSPRLNITSPEKGCGKSTLRDVLIFLVPRPVATESLTPAVLFRVTEARKPTILADEVDAWLRHNEELRALLDSGHRRGGQAWRCEGEGNEVRAFNVFAPAVLCGIGSLPGTLHDRSIVVRLERAKPGEVRKRFDSRRTGAEKELCRKFARWTADNYAQLEVSDPALPSGAFNRVADNWRPLFAIAEAAGGDWPRRAADAFTKLTSGADDDAQGLGTMLLADIRGALGESGEDRIFSQTLVSTLCAMTDRPWSEANHGKSITQNWVARHLKSFGIASRSVRIGSDTAKGYHRSDFDEAFDRYLSPPGESNRHNVTTPDNIDDSLHFKPSQPETVLRIENTVSINKDGPCDGVTDSKPGESDGTGKLEFKEELI